MAMPIIAAPMINPSEMFWSSSISLRIENGLTRTRIQKNRLHITHTDEAEDQRLDDLVPNR